MNTDRHRLPFNINSTNLKCFLHMDEYYLISLELFLYIIKHVLHGRCPFLRSLPICCLSLASIASIHTPKRYWQNLEKYDCFFPFFQKTCGLKFQEIFNQLKIFFQMKIFLWKKKVFESKTNVRLNFKRNLFINFMDLIWITIENGGKKWFLI